MLRTSTRKLADELLSQRAVRDARRILQVARSAGRLALLEHEAKQLVSAFGVSVPAGVVVESASDLQIALAGLREPYAVKALSPSLLHKTDAGGVRLGLRSAAEVGAAITSMLADERLVAHHPLAFLVEEMAGRGHELVVGGTIHPLFGPILMAGLGGIFVEIFSDVNFRICPIEPLDAHEMLDELKGASVLQGARGAAPVDRGSVVGILMALGGPHGILTCLLDEIVELDLNPVIASPDGAIAVDARVVLSVQAQGAKE